MTEETLNKANELTKKIASAGKSLSLLKDRVRARERAIDSYKRGLSRWLPFAGWFCRGVVEGDKVKLDVPIEGHRQLDFELDEECVGLIIKHEEEKIEKLKSELDSL